MKDELEGKIIDEFVGLKSKMYSMKNVDGKEFNEFKDTLVNKKIIRRKMRRIQGKNKKWEHTKSTKYYYLFLMIKDLFSIMVFICLLIFIKT